MSSDNVSTPPEQLEDTSRETNPRTPPPRVQFSRMRWILTGIVRVLYRIWTRIAARLFPEDSRMERLARSLHIPLPDQLNMSWITPNLAMGGRIRPEDIAAVARAGVTDVVDTRSEHHDDEQALAKEHIALLYLPARDTKPLTIDQMDRGARWVSEHMKEGGRVLIHCEHGVGRSALLTCAVLVYNGMSAADALHLMQHKRWQAAPNHSQIVRLREFEAALHSSKGDRKGAPLQ